MMVTLLGISSFLGSIPAGLWALLGTIVGTIGLRFAEKWLNKTADKRDDRREYREEIKELQERLDKVENEVTFWRNRFYEEQEHSEVMRIMLVQNGLEPPARHISTTNKAE